MNEGVLDLLNEITTTEQIEEFLESTADQINELDSGNLKKLRRKLYDGRRLQESAESFVKGKSNLNYDDINRVRDMVKEARDLRIGFNELESLNNMLKTYEWLLKLHALIQDDSIKAQSYERLFSTELDGVLPTFDIVEILILCKDFIEDKANNEEKFSALRETVESGEGIQMTDSRVQQLCEDYFSKLWFSEGEDVLGKIKTSRELERLLKDGPKFITDKLDVETLERYQDELIRIQDWRKLYAETIKPNIEYYLRWKFEKELRDPMQRLKAIDLKWKLSKLDSEYTIDLAKYTDLEKSSLVVQKYLNWMNWCIKVEETTNNIEHGVKIASFKELQELRNDATDFEIPRNLDFYKRVENWYEIAKEILKDYNKHKLDSNKVAIAQRNPPKSIDKESAKKVTDRYKNRPSQADAIKMQMELENKTTFISFSEEIDKIKQVLEEYRAWQLKLQEFVTNDCRKLLESAKEKDHVLEDHEQIKREIGYLKIDFAILDLRNEEDEFKLLSLEWQYRTYLLMKNLNKDADIEEWKKLITFSNENADVDPTFNKVFTKFLKEEMASFKKYHKTVKSLIRKEKSKELESPEDLERLLGHLQRGLIRYPDDEKFLDDLIQKAKKLVVRANQLVKSTEKEDTIEFTKTLQQIKLFPITLKTEEGMLENTIDIASRLASFIRRHTDMEVENVEKALVEYSKCPIRMTEVDKLQEKYEESKVTYRKLQEEVSRLNLLSSPTFEEIQDLSQRLDAIKWDHDGQLYPIKIQLYLQKVSILQNIAESESDIENPITLQALKSYVIEGQALKKRVVDEDKRLDQAVFWIDNLLGKAQDKVRELNLIKSVDALEKLSSKILGILDYSQEVIERKAFLTTGTAPPLPQKQQRQQEEEDDEKPKKSPMKTEKGRRHSIKKSVDKPKEKSRSDADARKDKAKQ